MNHIIPIDISKYPELMRLAEEVRRTKTPKPLIKDDETIAVLMPAEKAAKPLQKRTKTQANYEAFKSAAGGWKDIDTDKLLADIYEDRRRSVKPPIAL